MSDNINLDTRSAIDDLVIAGLGSVMDDLMQYANDPMFSDFVRISAQEYADVCVENGRVQNDNPC